MKLPRIKPKQGFSDKWLLMEIVYFSHMGKTYMIPLHYEFDLQSVPRILRSVVQKTDRRLWYPSLIHDFLYEYRIGKRSDADWLFYELMRENNVSFIKARLAYYAVRLGGFGAWND